MSLQLIQDLIASPALHDYLAVLKGARNGFVYGVKVRFPHALVMSILFGRGDWKARLRVIYRATRQHALNLAKFVSIYKSLLLLQKKANGGKERSADSFVAGLIGGYFVFGSRNAVNEQIVLYVVSRVVASFIPRASTPYSSGASTPPHSALPIVRPLPPDSRYFTVFAALSWGAVMWLFQHRGESIQPGMFNSMKYLYRDSESWSGLRTLLWHNT
ncbi:Tim17/Tim22/Tim23/Pmp24 family-domain-containing protein [Infundibulicybe gibba]|nr:Tim17/Tim22/Tim23/Pmp24 family-domain-containing protein [Infundibulicybe gibba]